MSSFEMDKLKRPRPELGDYGTEEVRDLEHAIEILNALRQEVHGKNEVAWDKLRHARDYLNQLLAKHVGEPEKEPK
jgi:hypothetical protein